MSPHPLTLHPFTIETKPAGVSITATVSRNANVLAVHFSLADSPSLVRIPPRTSVPARCGNLWQATCFEFFLATRNSQAYWEFNLSPSGDWNVYHLDAYRHGLREEQAFANLPFSVDPSANRLVLDVQIDLSPLVPIEQPIDLGVTAVIKTKQDEISYWALKHCGNKPDFHLRESFVLSL